MIIAGFVVVTIAKPVSHEISENPHVTTIEINIKPNPLKSESPKPTTTPNIEESDSDEGELPAADHVLKPSENKQIESFENKNGMDGMEGAETSIVFRPFFHQKSEGLARTNYGN